MSFVSTIRALAKVLPLKLWQSEAQAAAGASAAAIAITQTAVNPQRRKGGMLVLVGSIADALTMVLLRAWCTDA
jgi:hypothetical protein